MPPAMLSSAFGGEALERALPLGLAAHKTADLPHLVYFRDPGPVV
jgi:hypothetical protein